MATDKATFAEMELGGATGSDVTGSGPDRTWKRLRDPEEGSLGCAHVQPEVPCTCYLDCKFTNMNVDRGTRGHMLPL
jgi:hypothetical protein